MNALDYLLHFPWVEPLGRTLIHFLWQGAVVGTAAWGLLRASRHRSPASRHAVAAVALVLCVILPLATFLLLARPWRSAVPAAAVPRADLPSAATTTPPLAASGPGPVGQVPAPAAAASAPRRTTSARAAQPRA